jgi:hypothetical protein
MKQKQTKKRENSPVNNNQTGQMQIYGNTFIYLSIAIISTIIILIFLIVMLGDF